MADNSLEVRQLENLLANNKLLVARRDMALKLERNKEFKELILDGFCVTECARYARESGDPALTAEQRADAIAMAQAAGHLKRFLSVVVLMGNTAERDIEPTEEAIVEARGE